MRLGKGRGAVSVMAADTTCFCCDPVGAPSLVYSQMSSVFTFASCLVSCAGLRAAHTAIYQSSAAIEELQLP